MTEGKHEAASEMKTLTRDHGSWTMDQGVVCLEYAPRALWASLRLRL